MMIHWKLFGFDFDDDDKEQAEEDIRNVTNDVIEVVEDPKGSRASKIVVTYVMSSKQLFGPFGLEYVLNWRNKVENGD